MCCHVLLCADAMQRGLAFVAAVLAPALLLLSLLPLIYDTHLQRLCGVACLQMQYNVSWHALKQCWHPRSAAAATVSLCSPLILCCCCLLCADAMQRELAFVSAVLAPALLLLSLLPLICDTHLQCPCTAACLQMQYSESLHSLQLCWRQRCCCYRCFP
jgi:hypothetical protein